LPSASRARLTRPQQADHSRAVPGAQNYLFGIPWNSYADRRITEHIGTARACHEQG